MTKEQIKEDVIERRSLMNLVIMRHNNPYLTDKAKRDTNKHIKLLAKKIGQRMVKI